MGAWIVLGWLCAGVVAHVLLVRRHRRRVVERLESERWEVRRCRWAPQLFRFRWHFHYWVLARDPSGQVVSGLAFATRRGVRWREQRVVRRVDDAPSAP